MRLRRSLRAALRAYVEGHDRVRPVESKLGEEAPGPPAPLEFGAPPARPRYGVPVPERLRYHRGPSDWRDRSRRPETSDDV